MSDDTVNVEVNGVALKAKKGEMIIRVTDAAGVYVPRFCYHDKLSIAANCRMCLVEVEKAPKPLPACATPVAEGMKIFTQSPRAIGAQRATMEFLLINHPLDCPICDQGGECELQDLAVGFGRDASRYDERKRVVPDQNIGPLISTDMTRCIHCTRCIRFTDEIAGIQELGMIGRGEQMRVRSFIEQSVDHELSGNVIDLCPVGALNSKPFRFHARAWEMTSHPLVSPHDGVGTNLFGHVLRGKLMRVVPRQNEAINETWIADRDRFSYEGIYSEDRLTAPMIRSGTTWARTDWDTALNAVAHALRSRAESLGVLASASSTTEELYLLGRIVRGLGSQNIDHRLRQPDARDQSADPSFPNLGMRIADIDSLQSLLVIGSNLRREVPILAGRVRKAARKGAKISLLNPARFPYLFPVANEWISAPDAQVGDLAAVLSVIAGETSAFVPGHLEAVVRRAQPRDEHRALAKSLLGGERRAVWLGALALRHPAYADLRALAAAIAAAAGASFGLLAEGGNAAGAYLAGAVPHREAGGKAVSAPGLSVAQMVKQPFGACVLFGGVEPEADALGEGSGSGRLRADFMIAITPFATASLRETAHVLLPIGTFAETSGTFVNLEGLWQSFSAAARLHGEARPGWKVLRVLGNLLGLSGFDYQTSQDVLTELKALCASMPEAMPVYRGNHPVAASDSDGVAVLDVPMYQVDALVRRAPSLQKTREGRASAVRY